MIYKETIFDKLKEEYTDLYSTVLGLIKYYEKKGYANILKTTSLIQINKNKIGYADVVKGTHQNIHIGLIIEVKTLKYIMTGKVEICDKAAMVKYSDKEYLFESPNLSKIVHYLVTEVKALKNLKNGSRTLTGFQ